MSQKKLHLNREVLARLQDSDLPKIQGGIYTIQFHPCGTYEEYGCIPVTEMTCETTRLC